MSKRLILAVAFLAAAAPARASHCDSGCKIRIHACSAQEPARCLTDDVHPDQLGICAFMIVGVISEWQGKHPGMSFKRAECVAPDDSQI